MIDSERYDGGKDIVICADEMHDFAKLADPETQVVLTEMMRSFRAAGINWDAYLRDRLQQEAASRISRHLQRAHPADVGAANAKLRDQLHQICFVGENSP